MRININWLIECECGCGKFFSEKITCSGTEKRFISGHNVKFQWQDPNFFQMMSITKLGIPRSKEIGRKISKTLSGRKQPIELKKRWSDSHKELWKNPEFVEMMRNGQIGHFVSDESRKHFSERMVKRWQDPDMKRKMSIAISKAKKKQWEDPKFAKMMWDSFNRFPTRPELQLGEILDKLYPGEWKYTGDFSFTINNKCPDFVNCNGQKKIIEMFGDYWHRGEDPQDRIDTFKPYGYDTLVIWASELKDFMKVRKRIFDFVENGIMGN